MSEKLSYSDKATRRKAFVDALNNNEKEVEVIPSNVDIHGPNKEEAEDVGAYCRVSTMSEAQVESYELQKAYYEEMVSRHPNWNLVDIYPDEGISATSMKNRKNFLRMLDDCRAGKLSLIVTKSVSRFARNVVDGISTVRMLRNLPRPVAVYFETEHINSMSPGADAQLSLLSSFAESESLNKSTSMKWAIRSRFAHGIPKLVDLYGLKRVGNRIHPYSHLESYEPDVVRWMYQRIMKGYSISQLREILHRHRIPSPRGHEWWSYSSIMYVLTNEKYAGNIRMQKTVRTDMFLHKSVKNTGQERQYVLRDYHNGIVDLSDWLLVQHLLGNCDFEQCIRGEIVVFTEFDEKKEFRAVVFSEMTGR